MRGQAPGRRFDFTLTAVGTTIFIFGGRDRPSFHAANNELWAFDLKKRAYVDCGYILQ